MKDGKGLSAAEIAPLLGWSVSKVRRVLTLAHGCVDGLVAREQHRESYSTTYTFMQSGGHKVWVYEPTLETLRQMILELRKPSPTSP